MAGVPAGLLVGSALWHRVVAGIGLAPGATVPVALLLVVPGALAVALGASVLSARRTLQDRVAVPLRAE